jgi:hypothetical protein
MCARHCVGFKDCFLKINGYSLNIGNHPLDKGDHNLIMFLKKKHSLDRDD